MSTKSGSSASFRVATIQNARLFSPVTENYWRIECRHNLDLGCDRLSPSFKSGISSNIAITCWRTKPRSHRRSSSFRRGIYLQESIEVTLAPSVPSFTLPFTLQESPLIAAPKARRNAHVRLRSWRSQVSWKRGEVVGCVSVKTKKGNKKVKAEINLDS